MNKEEEKEIEKRVLNELEPVIKKLKSLYDEIDDMVKLGLITREQADDMMGVTLDKDEEKEKKQLKK